MPSPESPVPSEEDVEHEVELRSCEAARAVHDVLLLRRLPGDIEEAERIKQQVQIGLAGRSLPPALYVEARPDLGHSLPRPQ